MGTAHAGPITHSRKKKEAARKRIERNVFDVNAAGITKVVARMNPGAAKTRRASLALPVVLKIISEIEPPTTSPAIPANRGTDPQITSERIVMWRWLRRKDGE